MIIKAYRLMPTYFQTIGMPRSAKVLSVGVGDGCGPYIYALESEPFAGDQVKRHFIVVRIDEGFDATHLKFIGTVRMEPRSDSHIFEDTRS